MGIDKVNLLLRKLTATFVTTVLFSVLFVLVYFNGVVELGYNRGNLFIAWFLVYAVFIGLIILIYGNLVSITVEYLQRKLFEQHDWLYVLILGFFGLGNGILFQDGTFAIYGMLVAIIYGVFDKWIDKRSEMGKGIKPFLIIPIVSLVLCWGFLEIISPPMPPFTKEDAVTYATSGEGSITDEFPNTIGQWEGAIGGHQVIRKTSVEEIGKEVYIVKFTEHWKNSMEEGTWKLSYLVDRQSITIDSYEGDMPTYDKFH